MNLKRTGLRPALAIPTIGMLILAACSSNPDAGASTDDTGTAPFGRRRGHGQRRNRHFGLLDRRAHQLDCCRGLLSEQSERPVLGRRPGYRRRLRPLCAGEIDIADASRAIKDEEAALCDEAGISYIELQVGIDGLSVITSHDNAVVSCLSFADLYALLGPESQGFESWSDADALAEEIGSGARRRDPCALSPAHARSRSSRRVRNPARMTASSSSKQHQLNQGAPRTITNC